MINSSKNRFNLSDENLIILVFLSALGVLSLFAFFDLTFVKHRNISVVGKVQAKYLDDMHYGMAEIPYQRAIVAVSTINSVITCPVDPSQFHQMQPGDIGIVGKSIESFAGHEDSDCIDFKKLSSSKAKL